MNILDLVNLFLNMLTLALNMIKPTPTAYSASTIKTTLSTQKSTLMSTLVKNTTSSNIFNSSKACPIGYVGDNCETECGLTYFPQNVKIVGGNIAIAHSWPAHVYVKICYGGIFYLTEFKKNYSVSECFSCGGSLIDKNTVLTAGHCILKSFEFSYQGIDYTFPTWSNQFYPTNGSMYKLYLGLQNIDDMEYLDDSSIVNASRVIRHENYDDQTLENDIALIKLSKTATLSKYVQLACLPINSSSTYPPVNQPVYVIGWGLTSENNQEISDELRNVKITNYNGSMCKDVLPILNKNWTYQICAGEYAGGKDTCQGDSGGPLYYLDIIGNKAKYILAGITSYGDGCARYGSPGLYTRVSSYLDWINKNK